MSLKFSLAGISLPDMMIDWILLIRVKVAAQIPRALSKFLQTRIISDIIKLLVFSFNKKSEICEKCLSKLTPLTVILLDYLTNLGLISGLKTWLFLQAYQ